MEQKSNQFLNWIDRLNALAGGIASFLTALLVLLVVIDVLIRYLFSDSAAWVMELEWHLFALIFLFGAGYAFQHDRHVRVDLFYGRFSPKDKALVDLIGALVFLLPWSALLVYVGFNYAYESFLIDEGSPEANGLSNRWLIKFAIPIGAALLFLQGLASMLRAWHTYRTKIGI